MSRDEIQYIEGCLALRETEKGLLVLYEGEEIWLPKSKISDDSEVTEKGDEGILAIPEWLADEKGML
jgi:hypothetical protein